MSKKKCPKCGEQFREKHKYCSMCGSALISEAEAFLQHKKSVKKKFLEACAEILGGWSGARKIGDAAWYIATNAPDVYEYLQGEKIDQPESYTLLDEVVPQALNIVRIAANFRDSYNHKGRFEAVDFHNVTLIQW